MYDYREKYNWHFQVSDSLKFKNHYKSKINGYMSPRNKHSVTTAGFVSESSSGLFFPLKMNLNAGHNILLR